MNRVFASLSVLGCATLLFFAAQPPPAPADEIPEHYQETVRKALDYLVKIQMKDGHWASPNEQFPVAMTGLAGIALIMEGSTIREGKYSANIRRCADWLMDRSMKGNRDGLIGNTDNQSEQTRYMYGHGFATLFLALCYGDEEDRLRRERMKDILSRAVIYIGNAQSTQGGFYYTSKADGHDQDEGSVTVTQMQALRACRNAGIAVPKAIVKKGYDYLKNSTTAKGGVIYSLGRGTGAPVGGERPALTAAAIASLFSAGEYKDELVTRWLKYCQTVIPTTGGVARQGHDEYTHYYYAQVIYSLGDDGWEKLFGATPVEQRLTWSAYKKDMFENLVHTQASDGSWPSVGGYGPVYSTSIYATIMQLDRAAVPFYQR